MGRQGRGWGLRGKSRWWCGGVTVARGTPGGLDFGSTVGESCPQDVLRLDDGQAERRRGVGLEVRGVRKEKHYSSPRRVY